MSFSYLKHPNEVHRANLKLASEALEGEEAWVRERDMSLSHLFKVNDRWIKAESYRLVSADHPTARFAQ